MHHYTPQTPRSLKKESILGQLWAFSSTLENLFLGPFTYSFSSQLSEGGSNSRESFYESMRVPDQAH